MPGNDYSTRLVKRHVHELQLHKARQPRPMRSHVTSANLAWPHRSPLQLE
jgi:hypothetical protein